ncbi:hypothetical protein [Halorientalis sp. IM1011]|uniref:hypothetical protein n=1 Tax=Halorientalis sp. IM1011 TaxID=1932360 RepID=UPI0012F9EDB5|nr:hypothetical protein [Halorientalis sp. IM1011]
MDRAPRIIETIRERFRSSPTYRCGGCSLTFERERLNCPACGYPEITETRAGR